MDNRYDYYGDREMDPVVEHYTRVQYQINLRFELRAYLDPFAVSVTEFKRLYRIPQHLVLRLVDIISPYMGVRTSEKHIPLEIKLLVALSFYASGSYQRVVGRAADLSVSQPMVSRCIEEITDAFNHPDVLLRFIHFPITPEEREDTIRRNLQLGLPRVLGLIDGTLVKIVPPSHNENQRAYWCRKGYTAINVLLVCDVNLKILAINAQFPGSCPDPFIYRHSGIRQEMQRPYQESRCWLLGDSAFPLEPWLHTPLLYAEQGTPEYHYTRMYCHCRNPIERCNGVLKGRWRCLLHDRTLHYQPEKAGMIANACACLHNFCITHNIEDPPLVRVPQDDDDEEGENEEDEENRDGNLRRQALAERQFLMDYVQARRV